ncbi:PREDICTED: vinorine synthase-like [Ipomoea nil]|uniref:vinorine synthase-like n=1 Tax=Ipomoea nil TaxID=35883 RepID=UPI000901A0C7|nr:PREDICTED: vinorine synthase-like [Ipomoea nil]
MIRVEIIQKQTIKPSRPTPHNLRDYKFSLLDQLAVKFYVPVVLFYPTTAGIFPAEESTMSSSSLFDHLKESLSMTLTHLYPLAGRVKDVFTLRCNDDGALFVEARAVGENLSSVVSRPRMETLCRLLPCNPGEWPSKVNDYALLAVQVTEFPCGGIAVGACLWHGIADASTAATFLQTWATISRDGDDSKIGGGFVVDCSGIFAPRSVDVNQTVPWDGEAATKGQPVTKRFVFEGSKIATLREKLATSSGGIIASIPTRIEALTALIWAAFIAASRERNRDLKLHLLVSAVNLRKRMVPPLPPNSIGSTLHIALAKLAAAGERGASVDECRRGVQESIRRVKDPVVREVYGGGEGAPPESLAEAMEKGSNNIEIKVGAEEVVGCLITSSWCRFPFYEADMGWGKPMWVANAAVGMNTVVFLDTADGEGVEAWAKLREEDMFRLEQNQDFATLVSFTQTV